MTTAQLPLMLETPVDPRQPPLREEGEWSCCYDGKTAIVSHSFGLSMKKPKSRRGMTARQFAELVLGGLRACEPITDYSLAWPLRWSLDIYWFGDEAGGFCQGHGSCFWPDRRDDVEWVHDALIHAFEREGLRCRACVVPFCFASRPLVECLGCGALLRRDEMETDHEVYPEVFDPEREWMFDYELRLCPACVAGEVEPDIERGVAIEEERRRQHRANWQPGQDYWEQCKEARLAR